MHLNDLNQLTKLFKDHLFYLEQDKSVDRSSPKKVVKQLYFHYVLSTPLEFFGLNMLVSFVAQTDDGQIVGIITARRYPLAKSWIIGPVVCHKDFRNRGIATKLMNSILEHLRTKKATFALVSTEKSNKLGLLFFEKFGFKYLNVNSSDHKGARLYMRKLAMKYGYLLKLPRKVQPLHSVSSEHELQPTKEIKIWRILLKTIDNTS
ncbi:MAG: GNAT family N-acetyltransferase [Candidatus Bathyarchaeota archaeon]